jgi:WD40 repeat protein
MRSKYWVLLLVITLLAACATGNNETNESDPISQDRPTVEAETVTPRPTFAPQEGPEGVVFTPIPPAPAYVEAVEPITRANANRLAYLGRLDPSFRPNTVFAHALSPNNTQLAGLNIDRVLMWDLISGDLLWETARQGASFIYYSLDKNQLYAVGGTGQVMVLNAKRGNVIENYLAHPNPSGGVAYHQAGEWLAFGGSDGTIKVWDTSERESLVTFGDHSGEIGTLTFSDDGTHLAAADTTGQVKVWDWRDQRELGTIDLDGRLTSRLDFSPDGERLAIGTRPNVTIWQLTDTGVTLLRTLETGEGGTTSVMQFSDDGRFLITGGNIPDMIVWDAETGEPLVLLPEIGQEQIAADFSPNAALLVTSVLDGAVNLWNMESIDLDERIIVSARLPTETNRIIDILWTDDGFLLLFFDAAGPIYVWGIPPGS